MGVINNFASLLSLLASVSLAFVAVDYIKTYAETLHQRLFRFGEYLERIYQCCTLPDDNTIDGLKPLMVGSRDTALDIEQIKRDKEKMHKQIDDFKAEQTQKVKSICESKSMSPLCFFFFLGCVFLLFLGVVESAYEEFSKKASQVFCVLSCIVIVFSWCKGEDCRQWKWCSFTSLLHLFILFMLCAIFSLVLGLIPIQIGRHILYIPHRQWLLLLIYSVLVVLSFAVSIVRIWWKIRKQRSEVRRKAEGEHLAECKKIAEQVEKVKATMDLASNGGLSLNQEATGSL